jgi:hypothetical protein
LRTISWLIGAIRIAGLAEVPLDVELLAVAEAAVHLQGDVGGEEAGLGAEELRRVGLPAARQPAVDQPGRLLHDLLGGVEADRGVGELEADALVLPDRAAEDLALLGVLDAAAQRRPADAERGVGADHPLGVEPAEDGAEAVPDLADDVLVGHEQVVDEQLVGVDGVAAHLGDLADLHALAVHRREEQRQPAVFFARVARAGAGQQQHPLRLLRLGDPHLLARDQPAAVDLRAVVEMLVVSVPASGSVTAKETCSSPLTACGRNRCLSDSEPCSMTGWKPKMPMCTALQPPMPHRRRRSRTRRARPR